MQKLEELKSLNRELLLVKNPEDKAKIESKIKKFLDEPWYEHKCKADDLAELLTESFDMLIKARERVRYIAETVSIGFIDVSGDPISLKPFIAALANLHRTEQQRVTKFMLAWFEHLAFLPRGEYDLRNEASVLLAKKIFVLLEKDNSMNLTALPFI